MTRKAPIKGATLEERQRARALRTKRNRTGHYLGLMRDAAHDPRRQLTLARDYLFAVAATLAAPQVRAIAKAVTELADRYNTDDYGK